VKLSRTASYALQAVLQLAQSDASGYPVPCSRLAAEGKMPERFLLQILRSLVTHGILGSTRGVDGGYVRLVFFWGSKDSSFAHIPSSTNRRTAMFSSEKLPFLRESHVHHFGNPDFENTV
jgi:Rrf2 family protein